MTPLSRAGAVVYPTRRTQQVRRRGDFWGSIDRHGETGCWLWTGALDKDGYGHTRVNGQRRRVHRYSWELTHGQIPDGLHVLHKCDSPSCVNPAHLRLGTHAENMADRNAKRRQARGERNGRAKLTAEKVEAIRLLYRSRRFSCSAIGEMFDVNDSVIADIVARRTWRDGA